MFKDSFFSVLSSFLRVQAKGYFMYQFLDQESNFGPGQWKRFRKERGPLNHWRRFYTQNNAMFPYCDPVTKDTINQNRNFFARLYIMMPPLIKEKETA